MSPTTIIKKRAYQVLFGEPKSDPLQRWVNGGLVTLILFNLVCVVLETVESLGPSYSGAFEAFEIFSVSIFLLEYIVRLWCGTESERYQTPVRGRLRLAFSPMMIIDLLAILPFFLSFLIPHDLRFLRALRLLRLMVFLKLGRYSTALKTLTQVFSARRDQLAISFLALLILLFTASSVLYLVEHSVQPEKFPNIPATLWWGVITLTTVGYGDVYPVTALGKLFSGIVSVLGIGMFAVPGGILASGFMEIMPRKKAEYCPHCGERVE